MIFSEVKLFQVKPDKLEEFQSLVKEMRFALSNARVVTNRADVH